LISSQIKKIHEAIIEQLWHVQVVAADKINVYSYRGQCGCHAERVRLVSAAGKQGDAERRTTDD
jgi:hypothetical protein